MAICHIELVNVVSRKRLREFWEQHPEAGAPLGAWYKTLCKNDFTDLNDLHKTYPSADYAAPFTIFDVGGNKYRLITLIDYAGRFVKIRHVFTHREYDRWTIQYRKGRVTE